MVTHTLSHAVSDTEAWLAQLNDKHGTEKSAPILAALGILNDHGRTLTCESGVDLPTHCIATARQLDGMGFDPDTLVAALLCRLPNETLNADRLGKVFNSETVNLILGAARLNSMDTLFSEAGSDGQEQSETLRQMLLAMTDDIRVVLVKLADRTQALRELASGDEELRRKIARHAREYYAPLANRLGVWQLKWELEDLSCRFLEPDTYREIARFLDERRLDREHYITEIIRLINAELDQAGIKDASVSGRPKHIASILSKMRKKHLEFEDVFDVRAVRVLVHDIKDCYHVLGLVHSLWQPIPGQFDDYISRPKGNGYKSLHTAVIGPENKALEVQIRTFDMHNEAELGVAAHWRYKEGGHGGQATALQEKIAWVRELLAWRQETGEKMADSAELAQQFKNELFQDEVFVLTPQGKVIPLAQGATPVDFAYAVHTELGHRCRGAKVDGAIVPLDTALKTGQRIEILAVKQGGPSRDWLNPHIGVLKTSRARAKVRAWFKQQHLETHIQEGRAQLERELHRLGLSNINQEKLAAQLKFTKPDELYAALGRGDIGPSNLERALQDELPKPAEKLQISAPSKHAGSGKTGVLIEGEAGLMTTLAGCCKPVPPDPIVGYTTQGRGVTLHRADCPVITTLPDERRNRLLHASWGSEAGQYFPVDIVIHAQDHQGLLKDIIEILSQEKINTLRVNTQSKEGEAWMEFTLEVRDIGQLSRFLARAAQVRNVFSVARR